jgi:hypothetical protein
VKARVFQYLPICALLLAACGPTASQSPADAVTFATSKGLDDFEFVTAGDGKPGEWSIIENDAGRVLAQIDTDPAANRVPFAIYRPFSGRDVHVSTRFMTISGETGQAAGIAARDDRLTIFLDSRELFVAADRRVPGPPGKVGLWTKADSTTWFESLKIESLD